MASSVAPWTAVGMDKQQPTATGHVTDDAWRGPQTRRATVHTLGDGFHQVVLWFGFMEDPNVPEAMSNIASTTFGFDEADATYFLGRETVIPSTRPGMWPWRKKLFAVMHRNATSAVQYFGLPTGRVFESESKPRSRVEKRMTEA